MSHAKHFHPSIIAIYYEIAALEQSCDMMIETVIVTAIAFRILDRGS